MKKRLIALIVMASMLFSMAMPAFAVEQRETDFFQDRPHANINFVDMEPADIDADDALAKMDAVRPLLKDAANTDKVREAFEELSELDKQANTAYSLVYIYHSQDGSDEVLSAKLEDLVTSVTLIEDGLCILIRDILNSKCDTALDDILSDAEKQAYKYYTPLTDRQIELQSEITNLVNTYYSAYNEEFTATYQGKQYTTNDIYEAYSNGTLSEDKANELLSSIEIKRNETLGNIYLKLVPLYKELGKEYGYDSYMDFAYANLFGRDYTPQEIVDYRETVKDYIGPLYDESAEIYLNVADAEVFTTDYSGDKALDTIEPYIGAMSSEMAEAFSYMRKHGLYDNGFSANKIAAGYTLNLNAYQAPFFFNDASLDSNDLMTAIHEFGHYNNFYWADAGWNGSGMCNYDSAEVHSQGLELLMMHYYRDMMSDYDALALEANRFNTFVSIITQGALFDELQEYAFNEKNLTLEKMNKKFCSLAKEYGFIDPDYPIDAMPGWVEVPHSYERPFYYISYSTSAAGAFAFWQLGQYNYDNALDKYLTFSGLDYTVGFQDGFNQIGLESPISTSYIKDLSITIEKAMDDLATRIRENKSAVGNFADVPYDAWYTEDVGKVYEIGLMSGLSDTVFAPNDKVNRAMAAAIIYRMDGAPADGWTSPFTDVAENSWYLSAVAWGEENKVVSGYPDKTYHPNENVTREQLVTLLYRYANKLGVDTSVSEEDSINQFKDAANVSDYAKDAMIWACKEGIIKGSDGNILPKNGASRAELASISVRFLQSIEDLNTK